MAFYLLASELPRNLDLDDLSDDDDEKDEKDILKMSFSNYHVFDPKQYFTPKARN